VIPTAAAPVTRMAAEIREQPAALRRTLDALLPLEPAVAELAARTRQVLFIARGSSDAAALYGRYLCEVAAGRLSTPASPSVATRYRRRLDLDGVLAVALSQSGRTEEIVETLGWAADCGASTIAITNDGDSPLAAAAGLALVTQAGPERAVPATLSDSVWRAIKLGSRATLRRAPDGVVLRRAGTDASVVAKKGELTVTVVGDPVELALFTSGRQRAARVDLSGDDAAVSRLLATPLGF